tara:strand:- start:66248 stop:66868 length:621 start_codon:yes stop_codon:yes gene_type:complete
MDGGKVASGKVASGKVASGKVTRRPDKTLKFSDDSFRPNLTPREIFQLGSFGGVYWRKIHSKVTKKTYEHIYLAYASFKGMDKELLDGSVKSEKKNEKSEKGCDVEKNKYKVHSGTSLEYWESKGWILPIDPYGWVQWYTEYYEGRRSNDDERQIKRWRAFAGPKGRFLRRLANMCTVDTINDFTISPVIRQGLQHWGKKITVDDL